MTGAGQLTLRSGRVKRARRLTSRRYRAEAGEFLAEGPQAVREALAVPGIVLEVFSTGRSATRYGELRTDDVEWHLVDAEVVDAICGTVHPQGIVARCSFLDDSLGELLARSPRLVAVCTEIRDPGNAGTVVRCADAAGADAVVFTGDSVDPYNPKAVRASAGSLFHVPIATGVSTTQAVDGLRSVGVTVLAADADADLDLPQAGRAGLLAGPTAWLFGNEARGLSDQVRALADHVVSIPIYGRAESLNLATAAAVCLYASAGAHQDVTTATRSGRPER